MNKIAGWGIAFLAASLAPGVAISLFLLASMAFIGELQWRDVQQLSVFFAIAWLVSAMHVAALGLPSVYLLDKFNWLRGWTVCLAGFVGGMIPLGVFSWPLRGNSAGSTTSHWDGQEMVATMVDGIPTLAGWLSYLKGMAMMGALGAIAAFVFWLVWYRISKPSRLHQSAIPPMLVPSSADSKSS